MPFVRFAVKSEYGLGVSELYNDAVQAEDSSAVLNGVSVAALVGILRQLGDLTQFAAEVFHGLQEQVASTASRSRKLVKRVQHVEASLPQLEKAFLSQTGHMHYAYTPGCEWHAHIRNEQNHFICDDLPHFIMDSYEECREPPRLQMLDRFDTGGPGSCLKRYTDPTFFKRASASSKEPNGDKPLHERNARKIKGKKSWQRSRCFPVCVPTVNGYGRLQLSSSTFHEQSSLSHTGSSFDLAFKSNLRDKSDSLCSKDGMDDFIECVLHPSASIQPNNADTIGLCSNLNEEKVDDHVSISLDERSPAIVATRPESSSFRWDEKAEAVEPVGLKYGISDMQFVPETNSYHNEHGLKPANAVYVEPVDDLSEHGNPLKSNVDDHYTDAIVDAIQDVPKVSFELGNQDLKCVDAESVDQVDDLSEHGSTSELYVDGHYPTTTVDRSFIGSSRPIGMGVGIDDVQHVLGNFGIHEDNREPVNVECIAQMVGLFRGKNTSESIVGENPEDNPSDRKSGTSEVQHALETNFNMAEEVASISMKNVCQVDAYSEGGNAVTLDEWNQHNDIESETDHYVDALNTIESESESDFERHTKNERVLISSSKNELLEITVNEQIAEITSHQELEHECHSLSYNNEERQHSIALESSVKLESLKNIKSSCNESSVAEGEKQIDSACLSNEQSIQSIQSSSSLNIPQGIDSCDKEPTVCKVAASSSQVPFAEETIFTPHLSPEMPVGPSSTYPRAFWTNGTKLGLEPSKPTAFSMSNTVHSDPDTLTGVNNITVCDTNTNAMQKSDGSTGVLVSSRRDPECYNSAEGLRLGHHNQDDASVGHMSHSILDEKHDKSSIHDESNLHDHSVINSLRAGSLGFGDKPQATNPLCNNSENKLNAAILHSAPETNLYQQLNSPPSSPPPSPPLEHMKISFRPVDGSESSRLKLQYPNGVDNHEINANSFPSFQLVPEFGNLKHDIGSDSDDDTFCRSYACMSDDYLSHLSDSNSEWEFEDASESNYHALSDVLNRISSTESTSSSPQCRETAQRSINFGSKSVNAVHSKSDPSSELPIMSTKNSFAYQEMKLCLDPEADSSYVQQPTPHPPPLPPLQWRILRPLSDAEGHKQDQRSDNLNQPFDAKLSESSIPCLAADSARLLSSSEESATVSKTSNLVKQKLDPHNRNHQGANGRRADEKDDFLHQIRTKSFNLRRTEPARSNYTTSTATSNKAAAILQKANAIRRAVGSDGEDDSWSDR